MLGCGRWNFELQRESIVWCRDGIGERQVEQDDAGRGHGADRDIEIASCDLTSGPWLAGAGMVSSSTWSRLCCGYSNAAAVVQWFSSLASAVGGDVVAVFVQESAADEASIGAVACLEHAMCSCENMARVPA